MLVSNIGFAFGSDNDLPLVATGMLVEDEQVIEAHYICSVNANDVRELVIRTESDEFLIQVTGQQAADFGIDSLCEKSRQIQLVQHGHDGEETVSTTIPLVYHRSKLASIEHAMNAVSKVARNG